MKISIEKLLGNLLFLLVLFPYITFIPTAFDTQPYALLIAISVFIVYVISKNDNMPKPLVVLLFLFMYTIIMMFFLSPDLMSGIRSLVGYATLFFITFASYKTFKLINPKLLIYSAWLWLLVALIQFFVSKSFGSWMLPRISTAGSRGVTSLAVEPSYYAIVMIFMLLLNEVFRENGTLNVKHYRLILVLCAFQVLLTFSGMGFLFFMIFVVAKSTSVILTKSLSRKLKSVLGMIIVLGATILAFTYIPKLAFSRAGLLISTFTTDPMNVIMYDYSIAQRLSHIIISFMSLFQNYGFGFGVGSFETNALLVISNLPVSIYQMFVDQRIDPGGRLMSGWGSSIFELGVVGLLPIILFTYSFLKLMNRRGSSAFLTSFIVIFILMWMAVPYSFPLFSYFLGIVMYHSYSLQNVSNITEEREHSAVKSINLKSVPNRAIR